MRPTAPNGRCFALPFLDKPSGAPQHYRPVTGAGMPDYLVRNIDEKLAVRIKDYARDRAVTLNDAVLELIAAGLESRAAHVALTGGPRAAAVESEVRMLGGSWNADEAGAFAEAIRALERLPR